MSVDGPNRAAAAASIGGSAASRARSARAEVAIARTCASPAPMAACRLDVSPETSADSACRPSGQHVHLVGKRPEVGGRGVEDRRDLAVGP